MEQREFDESKFLLEKRILELESKLLENKATAIELRHALENSIFTRNYMTDLAKKIEENATIEPMKEFRMKKIS